MPLMFRCLRSGLLLVTLLLTGAAARAQATAAVTPSAPAAGAAPLTELLAYPAAPVQLNVLSTTLANGVQVQDVTFASVAGQLPVQAYVVRPAGPVPAGKLAGVLFVHWYEPSRPTSNRTQFLDEAQELARRGTVSLLVSTFWSDSSRYQRRRWQDDYQNTLHQARDLRRGLDVLLAQPGVDAARIGLVGHDYGALFATLVAAVDGRARAHVHIAGTARFADWYVLGLGRRVPHGPDSAAYRRQLLPLEPPTVLPGTRAQAVFYQLGENDFYTPRASFLEFYQLCGAPRKRLATYPARHGMDAPIIRVDRLEWLGRELALPAAVPALLPAPPAATGRRP
ncbi:dienelactone hydrolase family protein [Hymenobacter sp. APR13]|uniref:dienelactone hydrolase family protein n=1 Tax=Hymenobacter sp. APR13 TaxID=1356852 RepID=UPI0004E039D5|nr:hypothetical protein [Hymenobacter sp. APR13]AII54372.1 hypothetical protein N008_20590 [Hymenobacter sp. APR13]